MEERSPHILMFGWEYPPRFSGGLGVACRGLVRGLLSRGARVTLLLPRDPEAEPEDRLTYLDANDQLSGPESGSNPRLDVRPVLSFLRPYGEAGFDSPDRRARGGSPGRLRGGYGANLREEVFRYADAALVIASGGAFDVIHAHDWMTFPAAEAARRVSGKPLVVHVHATEYDRAGGEGDPWISALERAGLDAADRVVCVSQYTADIVRGRYGVREEKLRVVHNAVERGSEPPAERTVTEERLVLFAGRLTSQKGPDYFVEAAATVLAARPDILFVLAGDGDMKPRLMRRVAELGLGDRILFTGFLPPEKLSRLYPKADVFVLPSVSEPFGMTVLESLQSGTPVIISRRAGVGEIVRHALRVDFWDTQQLAGKILSLLEFAPLRRELSKRGRIDANRFSWGSAASACLEIYGELSR